MGSLVAKVYIIIWAGGACSAYVLLVSSSIGRVLIRPSTTETSLYNRSLDPKLGSRFEIPAKDVHGHPIGPFDQTVVILAGDCSSCSVNAIDPRDISPGTDQSIVFVYRSAKEELPKWSSKLDSRVHVVTDPTEALHRRANAVWQPRFILLDKDRRIIELSDNYTGRPAYLRIAKGVGN